MNKREKIIIILFGLHTLAAGAIASSKDLFYVQVPCWAACPITLLQ